MRVLFIIPALCLQWTAPAHAQQKPEVDAEQLSKDMITDVDDWLGQVNDKLQAGKPILPDDFDTVFGESFFENSDDPVRDLELAKKHINDKLGPNPELGDSYNKWFDRKLSPSDFDPKIKSDRKHITVTLKVPKKDQGTLKISVSGRLIKMNYAREERRRASEQGGKETFSTVTHRQQRAMPVPKGSNPSKYRIKTGKGSVSIIFDRLKNDGQRREASK